MRVGMIAALPGELAPLVRGWARSGNVYQGVLALPGGVSHGSAATVYASAAGMGAAAAARAFGDIRSASGAPLDAVVSYGWAGAISCGVKPPDVFEPHQVIDSRTGERFATAALPDLATLRLVTCDHVVGANEKRPLAERYQAVLVDMEAATVARLAQAHSIPLFCLKAISDGYLDVLPDFNRFLDREGQLRLPAFVAYAALRPKYWAALARLGANSRAAARNLAAHWNTSMAAKLEALPGHSPCKS